MEATPKQQSPGELLTELRSMVSEGNFDRVEELWMEALSADHVAPKTFEGLTEIAESLFEEQRGARFGALLELQAACLSEEVSARAATRLFELLLRLFPEKREYLQGYTDAFQRQYPVASAERAFFDAAGFGSAAGPVKAMERLKSLMRFREGTYVFHESGWGVGKVLGVDPFLKQVRVDLEGKRDHRIAIDAVDSILEHVPADGFRALAFEKSPELTRLVEEDPIRLITIVLDAFGNALALKEIKSHLVPAVISSTAWTKWWNKTKAQLRKTGFFRIGDRAPYKVERLQEAVSYASELMIEFANAKWPAARRIAKQVARRKTGDMQDAWTQVCERLQKHISSDKAGEAIDAAVILERGDASRGTEALNKTLARFSKGDVETGLQAIPGPESQRRAVASLPNARPDDWRGIAVKSLLGKSDSLREAVLDLLEKEAPNVLQAAVDELLCSPQAAPEATFHLLKAHVGGSERSCLETLRQKTARDLLILLLDLHDRVQYLTHREGLAPWKELIGRIHGLLGETKTEFFRFAVKELNATAAREMQQRIIGMESFPVDLRGFLLEVLVDEFPALSIKQKTPPWEERALYTTAEGLERRQDEFRDIMENKLPKNFEDIGRAASFGDLSENAEYTAALETRDHLTRQATQLKEEIDRAAVIQPNDVGTEEFDLGSRAAMTNLDTQETVVYSLLGPWDGGPEDGVLNYNSPLGRALYGKKVGDEVEVELPGGLVRFRIEKVGSHFTWEE